MPPLCSAVRKLLLTLSMSHLLAAWSFGENSSLILLGLFAGTLVIVALLYPVGTIGRLVQALNRAFLRFVAGGFSWWRRWLAWMPWPMLLAFLTGLHVLIWSAAGAEGGPSLLGGLLLVAIGGSACLAYVFIDLERYQVGRGHKVLHNPAKGQMVADDLVRYGARAGIPLLILATMAAVSGFALLNQGIYNTVGGDWYAVGTQRSVPAEPSAATPSMPPPRYADFLAYGLLNILRIVDLVDAANTFDVVQFSYVRQVFWPAATILFIFKAFFTMLLLQQIYAAVRRVLLLGENIQDFWSPLAPIHQRAEAAMSQHGLGVVQPLLASLRREQMLSVTDRERLSEVLAGLGPTAAPGLLKHLRDSREDVRAVAVGALGRLQAVDALPRLAPVCRDSSEAVRHALVEALGMLCRPGLRQIQKSTHLRQSQRWWWRWRWLRRVASTRASVLGQAVGLLRQLCADSSAAIRARAAAILGNLGPAAHSASAKLQELLGDADDSVRCQAAEALRAIGDVSEETAAILLHMLREPSPQIKIAAMHALTASRDEKRVVPRLLPLLDEPDELVRREAADMLKTFGALPASATPVLVAGLTNADNQVRAETAETLGAIGAPAADTIPALIRAARDDSDRVRVKAVQALGKMGAAASEATETLAQALEDEDHHVSALAAQALGEIGSPAQPASTGLSQALEHMNAGVRRQAAAALGKILDEAPGVADPAVLDSLKKATRDEDAAVRAQALTALATVGGATDLLMRGLEDASPNVRQAAVAALGDQGDWDDDALAAMARMLSDSNDEVQAAAAQAVGKTGRATQAALIGLVRQLQNDTMDVQSAAIQALGKLGPAARQASDPLLQAMCNGVPAVREQALRAITLIQPAESEQAFIAALRDTDATLRKLASAGLLKRKRLSADALTALVEGLRDPDVQVRSNVAQVLARQEIVPQSAIPLLLAATTDPDDGLRLNSLRALGSLSQPAHAGLTSVLERLLTDLNAQVRLEAAAQLLIQQPQHGEAISMVCAALANGQMRNVLDLLGPLLPRCDAVRQACRQRLETEQDPSIREELNNLLRDGGTSAVA